MTTTPAPAHRLRSSIGVTTEIHAKDCPACVAEYGEFRGN